MRNPTLPDGVLQDVLSYKREIAAYGENVNPYDCEEVQTAIDWYFDFAAKRNKTPLIEDLALVTGVPYGTLKLWMQKVSNPSELGEEVNSLRYMLSIKKAFELIIATLEELVVVGAVEKSFTSMYICHYTDYRKDPAPAATLTTNNIQLTVTPEQLSNKYAHLLNDATIVATTNPSDSSDFEKSSDSCDYGDYENPATIATMPPVTEEPTKKKRGKKMPKNIGDAKPPEHQRAKGCQHKLADKRKAQTAKRKQNQQAGQN